MLYYANTGRWLEGLYHLPSMSSTYQRADHVLTAICVPTVIPLYRGVRPGGTQANRWRATL